jgi:hypothetical protein
MSRSSLPRRTVKLSNSVQQHLNMHALAASAAGVGMLALATPAGAKIVYTPTHRILDKNDIYELDLNHDGTIDFTLVNTYACGTDMCLDSLTVSPSRRENGAAGTATFLNFPCAYALRAGAVIGPKLPFAGTIMAVGSTVPGSQWHDVSNRYLGLKFEINGKTHYGWARLSVHLVPPLYIVAATVTGYAYETIPGKPIIAGRTNEVADESGEEDFGPAASPTTPVSGIPQPATLGALATGAPGLSIWRRKSQRALRG